jgi:hypothetical protein
MYIYNLTLHFFLRMINKYNIIIFKIIYDSLLSHPLNEIAHLMKFIHLVKLTFFYTL